MPQRWDPLRAAARRLRGFGLPVLAQSPRRCFTARQECFESRHFEVKRNGDVLWAVSCLVARNFDGGVGPPMPSAPTLSTALIVTWRTSGDCVRAPFATILFHSTFGLVCRRSGTPAAMQRPAICHSMTRMQNSAPWPVWLWQLVGRHPAAGVTTALSWEHIPDAASRDAERPGTVSH